MKHIDYLEHRYHVNIGLTQQHFSVTAGLPCIMLVFRSSAAKSNYFTYKFYILGSVSSYTVALCIIIIRTHRNIN